jgi:hypothetical protein
MNILLTTERKYMTYYRILEGHTFGPGEHCWKLHWSLPKDKSQAEKDFNNLVLNTKIGTRFQLVEINVLKEQDAECKY